MIEATERGRLILGIVTRTHGLGGKDAANGGLIHFVNVVAHIFTPEHREYYSLELLWGDAPRIDWARSASA